LPFFVVPFFGKAGGVPPFPTVMASAETITTHILRSDRPINP
jgi:hypothetical protein